ncbi:MAG TPA: DUF427 domain-containing protein [Acidimicrobiales bacterium]|nr:DUF427 domain-containing protein [Acidimicrobiales bacterium]
MRPQRVEPGPGQESVWDYPRPPALDRSGEHVVVRFGGVVIADTRDPVRVLETSQAPAYYLPADDVRTDLLRPVDRTTWCEWKGAAAYWTIDTGTAVSEAAAWSYPDPTPAFAGIAGHLAFYPQRVDECLVDGELVQRNDGDFYGGWITSRVVGPFKGAPGTLGW